MMRATTSFDPPGGKVGPGLEVERPRYLAPLEEIAIDAVEDHSQFVLQFFGAGVHLEARRRVASVFQPAARRVRSQCADHLCHEDPS